MIRNKVFIFLFLVILSIVIFSCKKDDKEDLEPEIPLLFEKNYNSGESKETDFYIRTYEDGCMVYETKDADTGSFTYFYYYKDVSRNYRIETSIEPLWCSDDYRYGIMFLMKNAYSHYYMYIKEQQFFIGYVYNYNYHTICDYTYSEHINTVGQANKITIDKIDKHLDFYINDEKVFEKDISNEIGDQFGYKFKCRGKVAIDYLKVYNTN